MPAPSQFTKKHDWPTILERVMPLLDAGQSINALAKQNGLATSLLAGQVKRYRARQSGARQTSQAPKLLDGTGKGSPTAPPDSEGMTKEAARSTLYQIAHGKVEAKPGQVQALKMLAGTDEDEEPNPFAGMPEAELAERCLTLACSVLGVQAVGMLLGRLARTGMADVMGEPPEAALTASPTVETPGPDLPPPPDTGEVIP